PGLSAGFRPLWSRPGAPSVAFARQVLGQEVQEMQEVHQVQEVQEAFPPSALPALSTLPKSFGLTSQRRIGRPAVDAVVSCSQPAFTRPPKRPSVWSASRL